MRTVSIKTYLGLLSLGIAVAIVVIVIGIILPTAEGIRASNRELGQRLVEMENARKRTADPEKSVAELDPVSARVAVFYSATVDKDHELELIKTFESLAEQHGISQTLKLLGITKDAYQFSFINKGTFAGQMAFLHALEKLPYYVTIQKIDWGTDRSTGETTARFDATIYATAP